MVCTTLPCRRGSRPNSTRFLLLLITSRNYSTVFGINIAMFSALILLYDKYKMGYLSMNHLFINKAINYKVEIEHGNLHTFLYNFIPKT